MSTLKTWGMCCPKCKSSESIDVVCIISCRLSADGTDPYESRNGDHEWDDNSTASCGCGHASTVKQFKDAGAAKQAKARAQREARKKNRS